MKNPQSGQILILAIVVVGLVLVNTIFTISSSLIFSENSLHSIQSVQALNIAEAGIDKAVASLNATAGGYSGESNTTIDGVGVFDVTVTTKDPSTKTITATAYVPSKTKAQAKKTVKIDISRGNGVAFNYGVLVGGGGLSLGNNTRVGNGGSVYSNGNITMSNGSVIEGDLIIAGGVQPNPDQQTDCSGINCADLVFGKNVNGNNQLDIAQSFQTQQNGTLSKLSIKTKKVGTPPDISVRILADKTGKPDKANVLASSTLPASLVTAGYSFVDVAFATPPSLSADTAYWILLDTSANSSNYWSWQSDTSQPYSLGSSMWSSDWQGPSNNWNSLLLDLSFKTFMGGTATSVTGSNGAQVLGNVKANTIKNLTITKGAYYQAIANSTAASYFPNSTDPGPAVMPISSVLVDLWKSLAVDGGVFSGDITSCRATLGPGKYVGNATFSGCTITAQSPIWITGNLTLNNTNNITLANSFGSDSGVIIVDGQITIGNNNNVAGTGTGSSELMLISTYNSQTTDAITVSNSGNQIVLYAGDGIINVQNTNTFQQITGWKLVLGNGVVINYNNGFSSLFFSSGPGGAYSVVKGTYQIK